MLDHCKSMPQYSVCAMLGPMTAVHSGRVVHACLVILRPRHATDTSTNRRQGFLRRCTASVEQAADTAEAAAVNQYSLLPTTNISVPVCPWTPGYRLMTAFFMCTRSSLGWLSSRVVTVLDSGAEGPRFKSQLWRCRVTVLGKLFTPIVPLFTWRK